MVLTLSTACNKADSPKVAAVPDAGPPGPPRPVLLAAGPRLLSNQTSQPMSIFGEHLTQGLKLKLGPPVDRLLPLTVLDAQHAFTRLPADLALPRGQPEALVEVTLEGGIGNDKVRLINDTDFPDLVALALCPDGKTAFVADVTQDKLLAFDLATHAVTEVPVGDGPTALAAFADEKGEGRVAVVHRFAPRIDVVSCNALHNKVSFPAPANAEAVWVEPRGTVAFVAEHARDTVSALVLAEAGREKWRTPVAPNPRALSAGGDALYVGSLQTGEVEALEKETGKPLRAMQPGPGTSIVGGGTGNFKDRVMNGTAVRSTVFSQKLKVLFLSSIGPNIGPNPEKMEVSMNGGVAAVDGPKGKWLRHLGFGAGVTEGLALDDARGLLYAADVGVGTVRVLDVKKLAASDAAAGEAMKQEMQVPALDGFPRFRPDTDLGINGRAGPSLYSGPRSLALSPDSKTLWVLNRHTGTLAAFDVSQAHAKKGMFKGQWPLAEMLSQTERRLGQVLYDADVGRTAMNCDACHVEGHTGGFFFEKTMPMRIYRSPTVRGSRETPPFFTPASTHSMGETSKVVGGRNRFHNPDPTPREIEALTLFSSCLPTLPNPFVGEDGAPVQSLPLPDGKIGNPRNGLTLFYGKADCVRCHPPPHYTLDQDAKTRGKYLDVGTPHLMPLREAMQSPHFEGFGTPALAGSWDVFPMLTTALAGMGVEESGQVVVKRRDAMAQAIVDWAPKHGRADLLSDQEKSDLIAFVMSL
jgi:DNA-binding beta-propeller fold protein YncE